MASFRKRGELQWQARIARKGFPPQVKTFNTRAEAESWALEVEASMKRGTFVDRSEAERTTLSEALERYEREVTVHKKSATQEKGRIKTLKDSSLASLPLASIRGSDIANYRDKRTTTVSASSILNELAVLSHLFTIARKEWGMEHLENPVLLARKPKRPAGRDRRLMDGEEQRLLDACEKSQSVALAQLVIVAVETAMRLGELLSLTWDNIDLKRRVAMLPDTKNGDARLVPLSSRAANALQAVSRHIQDKRVFWNWQASDSVRHGWQRAIQRARTQYEKECLELDREPDADYLTGLRFHDLRHEATSRLFELGFNPMEVAAITGHKTLQMLKRYTHLRAEDLAKRLA